MTRRLEPAVSGALRQFAFWIANGTVGLPLLEGLEYRSVLMSEPSALEQVMAIFANVLELDESGQVTNAKYAERRAAQWLRAYLEPGFVVEPPFEDWEVALH